MDLNTEFQMLRFMYNFHASNRHSSGSQLLAHFACGAQMLRGDQTHRSTAAQTRL